MTLYRTYRPKSFADVVGQDHIVSTLENAVEQNKLAHAYLFSGSRGTGKTSVARILAKTLMTQNIEDETLRTQIMQGIEDGNIVDLLEIDAASNRRIDDARDLIEKIQFSPVVATAKVYIIDEVHMLTKEAFNALLKTLEEPPDYAYFILATTELNKIPVTIQSRCQCFPFRRIREEEIIRRLQYIADTEKISVDRGALRAIANHVEGGMRDAISLLDQLRALPKITADDVAQRIGVPGHEHVDTIFTAINTGSADAIVATVHSIEDAGIPLDAFLRQILSAIRKQMHAAVENGQNPQSYLRMLDVLLKAIRDVRIGPVPGLVVEAALLSICNNDSAEQTVTLNVDDQATQEMKSPESSNVSTEETPTIQQEEKVEASEQTSATVEVMDPTMENMKKQWTTIVKETTPPAVRMSLRNGFIRDIEGTTVRIAFESAFHRDKVAATEACRAVEKVMEKIFRQQLRLECILEEENGEQADENSSVNLAEAASEIF